MQGVFITAFGKPGYVYSAFNLAVSLRKFSPGFPVALLADSGVLAYMERGLLDRFFERIITLPEELKYNQGKFCPAKVKCNLYPFVPYDETLYLDADTLCLKPIDDLMARYALSPRPFTTCVLGSGTKDNDNINYNLWAYNAQIWPFFNLPEDATLHAIQSSYAYIRKGKDCDRLFREVKKHYDKGFPVERLRNKWGGTLPDELIFSGVISKLRLDVKDEAPPVYFGNKYDYESPTELEGAYHFLSMFGGKNNHLTKLHYQEWYDNYVFRNARELKVEPIKRVYIMRDKHLNNK